MLKEYEVCQQHINSIASRYWVTAGIFMAINTALLGGVAFSIISKSVPLINVNVKWLVLVLGLGIIVILLLLIRSLKRVNFIIHINFDRMREIEHDLGMWKNWRVHGLDHWETQGFDAEISSEMKDALIRYHTQKWWQDWKSSSGYILPSWYKSVQCIFYTIISMWVIFIFMAFIFS